MLYKKELLYDLKCKGNAAPSETSRLAGRSHLTLALQIQALKYRQ